jgi:NAD-dependent SIR2 family protein deacetylase
VSKDICGVFITEYESPEKANAVAAAMKNCPHLVIAGTSGKVNSMTFIVPESLRWWFEGPADNPDLLGAKKVDVFIIDDIVYPEKFTPRLPPTKVDAPPCGSNCSECPMREKFDCPGCPATKTH